MTHQETNFSRLSKLNHAGLALFGIAAYLTAESAEAGADTTGYLLHAYLGLTLSAFVVLRVLHGSLTSGDMRFSSWAFWSSRRWREAFEDLRSLFKLRLPDREKHGGIAGLVQAFGLIISAWMAATGTGLYLLDEAGSVYEWAEELHEVGEALIPAFLLLHIGAVIAHSLAGQPVWHRMWRFRHTTHETLAPPEKAPTRKA